MPEANLSLLLKNMNPVLHEGIFVFHSSDISFKDSAKLEPIMIFKEAEGTAFILHKERADKANLDYIYPSSMITLKVSSSLDAIGFLAAITNKLADNGVSVNPVSAHFHDHLFVPEGKGEQAMALLNQLAE